MSTLPFGRLHATEGLHDHKLLPELFIVCVNSKSSVTWIDGQVAAIIVEGVVETKGTQVPKSELVMKIEMQLTTCWLGGLQSHSTYIPVVREITVRQNQLMGCYGQSQGQFQLSTNFTM
jgi:hypothetical protein